MLVGVGELRVVEDGFTGGDDAGDALTDGPLVPHDILRIKGEEALQRYLLAEIQNVQVVALDFNDDYSLPDGIFSNDAPLTFVVNPNAPSGTMVPKDRIRDRWRSPRS